MRLTDGVIDFDPGQASSRPEGHSLVHRPSSVVPRKALVDLHVLLQNSPKKNCWRELAKRRKKTFNSHSCANQFAYFALLLASSLPFHVIQIFRRYFKLQPRRNSSSKLDLRSSNKIFVFLWCLRFVGCFGSDVLDDDDVDRSDNSCHRHTRRFQTEPEDFLDFKQFIEWRELEKKSSRRWNFLFSERKEGKKGKKVFHSRGLNQKSTKFSSSLSLSSSLKVENELNSDNSTLLSPRATRLISKFHYPLTKIFTFRPDSWISNWASSKVRVSAGVSLIFVITSPTRMPARRQWVMKDAQDKIATLTSATRETSSLHGDDCQRLELISST